VAYTAPTVADFKSRFDRDFPFALDQSDMSKVRDKDITTALGQAAALDNPDLWGDQATYAEVYLLRTAHNLCVNLLASSQGLGGSGQWLTNSKAVGNVNESYSIPERILRSPTLSLYSKTTYGCQFLSLIALRIAGNVMGIVGTSHAT
jgi:Protein of unknown function (DUF4054)